MGGCLRHPETAAIGPRIGEPDPDGRRIEVVVLAQLLLLDDPDPPARFGDAGVGRGRPDAGRDVPLLPGVKQVQGVWQRRYGLLLGEESRETGAVGPMLREGRVAMDRRRAWKRRRALPRVRFRGEAHAVVVTNTEVG